ncbi:MAG: hypothetical protein JWR26_397 [Pedosphaera sp.]|nr:hypothetical protein [Pedosphaera sp.]
MFIQTCLFGSTLLLSVSHHPAKQFFTKTNFAQCFRHGEDEATQTKFLRKSMNKRYKSRPAPAMSAIAAIVGIIMVIFVIGFIFTVGATSSGAKVPPAIILFVILWILLAIIGICYHLINAMSDSAPATTIIESEDGLPQPRTAADRLRELDDLRAKKLVSDSEYEAKRQVILKEL